MDADQKGMWWTGLVVKQIGGDKYLVLFDSHHLRSFRLLKII